MDTNSIKDEVEKNIEKLAGLRDEVKLKLHLASLDVKQEWDEKLSPRVFEAETAAKNITESSRTAISEVVAKVEEFVGRLRGDAPHSTN